MIRYLIAAVLTLWLSTSSAFAAREMLLDFTTCSVGAKNASADCTPWTGNYSSTYASEQFVVSANDGVTVYSDVSKQETASDSYCSVIISATKGGAIDWKDKNFEIVLKGTPMGRDGNSIKVNFVDGGNETFTFAPTRTYMDYGSGDWHLVYNGLTADKATNHWGGDNNGTLDGALRLSSLIIPFDMSSSVPGEITFNRIVSAEDSVARSVEVVESISLDSSTYPGAAPFPGAYKLEFALSGAMDEGASVKLYLYTESNARVTSGTKLTFDGTIVSGKATFVDLNLDPAGYYHFYGLGNLASGVTATSGTGYFRQTAAEAMRLDVSTGNALHLCRDESECPKLVVGNPSSVAQTWSATFDFRDTFGNGFNLAFNETVSSGSSVEVTVPWASLRKGVWYVSANVTGSDGSTAIKSTQFAYVPSHGVTGRMAKPKFRFGIHNHGQRYLPTDVDNCIAAIVAAGAKFTRTDYGFMFADICPSEAIYNSGSENWSWETADTLMEKYMAAGLSTEIIVYASPSWAWDQNATWNQSDEGRAESHTGRRPMREGLMRNFCEAFGDRFKGKIDYYEVGNEWDMTPSVTMSPEEALAMQREAYEGLHAGDPNACVCPNGWASTGVNGYNGTDNGIGTKLSDNPQYFDNWLVHLHGNFEKYATGVDEQLKPMLREKLNGNRSWSSGETAITSAYGKEREQGAHVWYKTLFAWNRGARDYIWYNLKATGWFDGNEPGYGLMTADYHPRAGYAAFAAITDIFEGLDADGTVYENGSRMLFRYRGTNSKNTITGIVLAGWDRGTDENWTIRVNTDASSAEVSDHMGNRTSATITGGVVEFSGGYLPKALILKGATYAVNAEGSTRFADKFASSPSFYVDASAAAGGDGTQARPFNTIQPAINAARSGDQIEIAAGVYECPETPAASDAHLVINNKRLYLKGAGREKTIIKGKWDSSGEYGIGAGAKRCLNITGSGAKSCLFEGLNFEYGSTATTGSFGGVYATPTGGCFVACVFRRCSAAKNAGAVGGATQLFIRCLFDGNICTAESGGSAIGGAIAGCYNCVMMRGSATATGTKNGNVIQGGSSGKFVNCTMIFNRHNNYPYSASLGEHYNGAYMFNSYAVTRGASTAWYCTTDIYGALAGSKYNDNTSSYAETGDGGVTTNHAYSVFSPLTFDFRPIPNAPMVARGNPEYVGNGENSKILWVPEEYRNIDYDGKPRMTGETVCRGAVEEVATEESSTTALGDEIALLNYAGGDFATKKLNGARPYFRVPKGELKAFHLQYQSTTNDAFGVYNFNTSRSILDNKDTNGVRAPDVENGFWFVPPKENTVTINWNTRNNASVSGSFIITANLAKDIKWVESGKDDYTSADGSEEKPFETIQQAVNAIAAEGVVKVKPGVYDKGYAWTKGNARVSITKAVRIVGIEGPEKTIVVGQFNSSTNMNGNNAIRGFYVSTTANGVYSSIAGLTITGCATLMPTTAATWGEWAGGAVYAPDNRFQIVDCILSNNCAGCSGGAYRGWSQRCKFIDNHQEWPSGITQQRSSMTDVAHTSSCLFHGSSRDDGYVAGIGNGSQAYNCTVRILKDSVRAFDDSSRLRINCIVIDSDTGPGIDSRCFDGSICWNDGVGGGMKKYAKVIDPQLVNPAAGDFRPVRTSPAFEPGGSATNDYYHAHTVGTLDNLDPIVNGHPIVGCYGDTNVVVCVAGSDMSPAGRVGLHPGESITLKPGKDRPVIGYKINNSQEVTPSSGKAEGYSYVFTATGDQEEMPITIVYGTNWYVNATSGSDTTGDGYSAATATKTLKEVFSHEIVSGDVVHAAEGMYDEGEVLNVEKGKWTYVSSAWATMYSRVKVPDGVMLKADGRREKTFIVGRWHSSGQRNGPVYSSTVKYPDTPNNALRGVALGHNSILEGFVVSNGCATGSASGLRDDNLGGGIIGFKYGDANGASYVKNCTITGSGERNGAVEGCVLENCYLYNNDCSSDGSQCANSRLINCLVYNDKNCAICKYLGIFGTTIIDTHGNASVNEYESGSPVVNSIIINKLINANTPYIVTNWHNCVVRMERTDKLLLSGTCTDIRTNTLAQCQLDANGSYAPLAGSPAIDWGNAELSEFFGAPVGVKDYRGEQRVYNGAVDAGCNEYDWRPKYTVDLVHPLVVVTNASEMVVEAEQNVNILNGAVIAVKWPSTSGNPYCANFTITGLGTVTVMDNDGNELQRFTRASAGDPTEFAYEVDVPNADTSLALSFEGADGAYATLLPFRGNAGLQFIFK